MTILTPKGYSPARQPASERPAEEEIPTEATMQPESVLETAVGMDAAELPREEVRLTFPPQVTGINCPNCGTPYPVQIFSIVDAKQDPILKTLLLSGQLNMAACPRCGAGGAIAAPLLYHDPAHNFIGVYVPEQMNSNEQQQVIGQLSKRLMDGLPPEERRGYMLTPKQFLTYQGLLEAVLEHEGVTREMLDKQRRSLQLLEQALTALKDSEGLRLLVEERDAEMDDQFFGLLQTVASSSASSGDAETMERLLELRERLVELTTWGKAVQKQRAAIAQLQPDTTPSQLLDMIIAADDERVVDALVTAARPLVNYGFYQDLTGRAEAREAAGDAEEATRLAELRDHILSLVERLDQLQRAAFEESSQVLSEILASEDIHAAVEERALYIDQNFLSVLAANLQRAEKQGATAAVRRLQQVWDAAVDMIQASAPPQVRLINDLVNAEYPGETRQILAQNRDLVTEDLIESMTALAQELQDEGNQEVATKLRQIRSQAQLMR